MRISVKTDFKINKELISKLENNVKMVALYKTAQWVLTEVIASGKVPKDTGALELSAFVKEAEANIVSVVFDTPYARRWYFNSEGAVFRKEYNANATDHWMDDFIHGERKQELVEMFVYFYREEAGGLLK